MPDPLFSTAERGNALVRLADRLRRPVAKDAYRAEIDGLRFLAIAIVVIGHFMERATRFFPAVGDDLRSRWPGELLLRPGIGVYLFFAISGFVIARQVLRAQVAPLDGGFLKVYFGRRILRIEPPYILLLLATWALIAITGYAPEQTSHFDATPSSMPASAAGSVFYLHDLIWGTYPRLFPAGWSLEVEVQFYLLAPLLLWGVLRSGSGRVAILVGAFGLFVGALVSVTAPDRIGPVHTGMSILQFFHFFWLGIVLARSHAWIGERTKGRSPFVTGLLGWAGLIAYFAMPAAPSDDSGIALMIRAANLLALTAMFVSAFAAGSSFRRFCQQPIVSVIGGACYSIYLTHLQVIQVLTSLAAKIVPHPGLAQVFALLAIEACIVTIVGMVFYALIERTFMIKDWPTWFWACIKLVAMRPATPTRVPSGRRL